MSAMSEIPEDCDFIVVRRRGGFAHLEAWRIAGRLSAAMHGVVDDMFDGKYSKPVDMSEFALGFIAAMDAIGRGRVRLQEAQGKPSLRRVIEDAYGDMHGRIPHKRTTVMTDACAAMVERGDDK